MFNIQFISSVIRSIVFAIECTSILGTKTNPPTESEEDEENVDNGSIMDSSHNLDSHFSDTTQTNSTTSTATALHIGGPHNAGDEGGGCGGGGGGLAPPRNLANRRTSLADIISRVRRTSAGLQAHNPLQPLTESKSELPHYSIPGEKFADKRVKVSLLSVYSVINSTTQERLVA